MSAPDEGALVMAITASDKRDFLTNDFYGALRWLFEGAVAWKAAKTNERCRHQAVLGMSTAVVQARALYEFFFDAKSRRDDARAKHFASSWSPQVSSVFAGYMADGKPTNKRFFHLVFRRHMHSGGKGHDGPDHLKNQVLAFAGDVRGIAEQFVASLDQDLQPLGQSALRRALDEAAKAAHYYGIPNPL